MAPLVVKCVDPRVAGPPGASSGSVDKHKSAGRYRASTTSVVWGVDPKTERVDLAVPLEHSGSGIGQVLAILYVVLTSNHSRTLLIDEPQSFLHPGAARKLIELLRAEFPQHQFVVSTHSPSVINAADPDAILLARNDQTTSTLDQVDMKQASAVRGYLAEVGA